MDETKVSTKDLDQAVATMEQFSPGIRIRHRPEASFRFDFQSRTAFGMTLLDFQFEGLESRADVDASGSLQAGHTDLRGGGITHDERSVDISQPFMLHDHLDISWESVHTRIIVFENQKLESFGRRQFGDDSLVLESAGTAPISLRDASLWPLITNQLGAVFDHGDGCGSDLMLSSTYDLAA